MSFTEIFFTLKPTLSPGSASGRLVMHLNRLDFSGDGLGSESDNHAGFDDASFDTTNWDGSDTTNFVDVLEWQTEWFVAWANWWGDTIESIEEGNTSGLAILLEATVPRHVLARLSDVVTMPS